MKKTGIMWSLALLGLGAAARCLVTEPRPRSSQRLKSASTRLDQNQPVLPMVAVGKPTLQLRYQHRLERHSLADLSAV